MSNPMFTPGPWESDDAPDIPEIWDANGYYVADASGSARHRLSKPRIERPSSEAIANARLIAAAPDMHAALEHILNGALSLPRFAEDAAKAALAKARGETP